MRLCTSDGGETGQVAGGRVAAHHDVVVAALLEVRIEDRLQATHRPRLGTLGNQLFSTNPSDDVVF
jgi:hypothetical protein